MRQLDQEILAMFFVMQEAQRQRLWMQRIWHPTTFRWAGGPPKVTHTGSIRKQALDDLGFGPSHYDRMLVAERDAKTELEQLATEHPLAEHFEEIRGLGSYLCGSFIAAGGDIERAPRVSSFWRGMGLDLVDGVPPRRERGKRTVRPLPAYPHVTRVGEQIRHAILRSRGVLKSMYDTVRAEVDAKNVDRKKIWNHKGALRIVQKRLYACLWREWRLAYDLDAPDPYAFAILHHDDGHRLRIEDFYEK